ncbi:4Fe-4S ferredoxin [Malonomonas rubra]|uniref:4Fe-4S ferredoxin n=1 Tax=Malonomonas rubra TaxID=57040 RepID=UPI0026EACE48|nr:4Fe-4S ferredoxin [Malonomonas rubra]
MVEKDPVSLEQIHLIINNFWATSPLNSLHLDTDEKAWSEPQIAVARADDPLFDQFKGMIGDFLWTPEEAFAIAFPEQTVAAAELRVISYLLPQTEATRADQRQEQEMPSERWARSRFHGEEFNCALRLHLAETLTEMGYPAVAPERLPDFAYQESKRFGIASNWSERHVAFVAGNGTFGLSDGLITRFGKAVRFGSVVVKCDLPRSERPYGNDHQAWCLWYAKGTCGACAHRCPAGAIATATGHNKPACFTYIREATTPYSTKTYGTGSTPCGLCQVKIPCEHKSPLAT